MKLDGNVGFIFDIHQYIMYFWTCPLKRIFEYIQMAPKLQDLLVSIKQAPVCQWALDTSHPFYT